MLRLLVRAHPRSRGEHPTRLSTTSMWMGSSPLARGTRKWNQRRRRKKGLIPARAGNTGRPVRRNQTRWAHPRSRGEHFLVRVSVLVWTGSSPLARGTLSDITQLLKSRGLIPARAGNTQRFLHGVPSRRAHPRSRGEHLGAQREHTRAEGSSPLARGTPHLYDPVTGAGRLIPARAGNTIRKQ